MFLAIENNANYNMGGANEHDLISYYTFVFTHGNKESSTR